MPFSRRGLISATAIPVPSMKYLIEEFYRKKFKTRPDGNLYRAIKDVIDGRYEKIEQYPGMAAEAVSAMGEQFVEFISGYYDLIMEGVAALSWKALCEKGLNLIIFPEGTRGTTLGEGRTGLAQVALATGKRSFLSAAIIRMLSTPGAFPLQRAALSLTG